MRISRFSTRQNITFRFETRFILIEENEARQWNSIQFFHDFYVSWLKRIIVEQLIQQFLRKVASPSKCPRCDANEDPRAHPRRGRLRRGDFILRDVPKHRRGAKRMHSHADVRYLLVRKGENSRGESSTRWKSAIRIFVPLFAPFVTKQPGKKRNEKKKKEISFLPRFSEEISLRNVLVQVV